MKKKFNLKQGLVLPDRFKRRATFFVLVLSGMMLTTTATFGQPYQQPITVNFSNVTVLEAIRQTNTKAGNCISYRREVLEALTKKVTLNLQDTPALRIVQQIMQGTGFTVETAEGQILLTPRAQSNNKPVLSGRVTDESGKPLPGATVFIEGTITGVATDAQGRFSLNLPDGAVTVLFSFIGLESQKLPLPKLRPGEVHKEVNIVMRESQTEMEEVIVTGIFSRPRESYTGSVTTITAKELEAFRGQNLIQTLATIDPAINIMANNEMGSNPNVLPQINIRGNSTLPMSVAEYNSTYENSLNTPLIIMDGFQISLTKLMDYNDDEIESINILKDASATAIYGSRGANGVIVIISKTPKAGKLRTSFSGSWNLEFPDLTSYDLLNARELFQLQVDLGMYTPASENAYDRAQAAYSSRKKDIIEGVNTDWLHYPVRTGVTQGYNIRLEGGSSEFRWGASLRYNITEGVMKDSKRNNLNGAIILSYTYKGLVFRNQLTVGVNKAVESPYGSFSNYATLPQYYRPYDEDGNLVQTFMPLYSGYSTRIANPLYDAVLNTINESNYIEIINNFSIDWKILEGMFLRGGFGVSQKNNESDRFYPPSHTMFQTEAYESDEGYFRRGRYNYSTGKNFSYNGNITLNYSKIFAEKHHVYAGADFSLQQSEGRSYSIAVEGFSNDNASFFSNAAQYLQNGVPTGSESTTRRVGFTANANYTYDSRYYVDGSVRMDGSSQFGANSRFAPFWSLAAGWSVHNEPFLKDNPMVNSLRLKLSYGVTGSTEFSAYDAQVMYRIITDDKYLNRSGASLYGIANEDLEWQTTNQFNAGVEATVWNNRFQLSFDYYIKSTTGMLSSMHLPRSTGYSSYIDNIGEVRNTGAEASLSANILRNQSGWTWTFGGRIAYNKNEIVKLSESIKEQTEQYRAQNVEVSALFYEGYSQNSIWAVKSLGIDPSTGLELYLDADGNVTTTWNPGAKVYCGDREPKLRGNLTTMLRYKNLTLNAALSYHWGGQLDNGTLRSKVEVSNNTIARQNVDRRVFSARWKEPGDVTFFKGHSNETTRLTSRFIMDDNVFQLSSASLQYRLHRAKFLEMLSIQSLSFSVNMSDLFYLSSIKRERGTSYPFARRVGISLSLQF